MNIDPALLALLPFELQVEISENLFRKDWTPSEIDAIRRRCEAILKAQAKQNQAAAGPSSGRGAKRSGSGKIPDPIKGQVRDKIGAFAGISGRTVEKIKAVCEAAEAEPDRFAGLVDEMDRTDSVNTAFRKLQQAQDEQRVLGLKPIVGKFRTLVIDPPWEYEQSIAGRAKPGYATMTLDELRALNVATWGDDEGSHLYLWTTNSFVIRAGELMEHWGFNQKTMLTWMKPHGGLGNYFRNQTEHVLFGVRGNLNVRPAAHSISTWFEAPTTGEHSEKPERFYEIVRAASYPPYGEAFQRTEHAGFINLFTSESGRIKCARKVAPHRGIIRSQQ